MSRPPMNMTIDQGDFTEIDNGSLASFPLLAQMDYMQHSLGTQFMGPPTLLWVNSSGTQHKIQVMVPPNCQHAHVFLWAEGEALAFFADLVTVTFTTAVDTIGTSISTNTNTSTLKPNAGQFFQSSQTGAAATSGDPIMENWLKLVAGTSWEWQVAEVTMGINSLSHVYAVGFFPVHTEWQ